MNPLFLIGGAIAAYFYTKSSAEKKATQETKANIPPAPSATEPKSEFAAPTQKATIPFLQPKYSLDRYVAPQPINALSEKSLTRRQAGIPITIEEIKNGSHEKAIGNIAAAIGYDMGWNSERKIPSEEITESKFDEYLRELGVENLKSEIFIALANIQPLNNSSYTPEEINLRLNNGGLATAKGVKWIRLQPILTEENKNAVLSKIEKEDLLSNNLGIFAPIGTSGISRGRIEGNHTLVVYNTPKGNLLVNVDPNGKRNIVQVL